jgi:uncharacterized protein DUF4339
MSNEWYIRVNDKNYGPASLEKLKDYIRKGQVTRSTLVRDGKQSEWRPAGDFADLFGSAPEAVQPPPIRQSAPQVLPPQPSAPRPPAPPRVPEVVVSPPPLVERAAPAVPVTVAAPNVAVQVNIEQSKAAHSLGIGAMVLGIVGLLTACIPFVSLPLSGIGFLLGAFGIGMAIMRKGTGIGFSIAGAAISGVIFLPTLLFWTMLGGAFSAATNEVVKQAEMAERTNQSALDGSSGGSGAADDGASWADARQGVRQGDVTVKVISAKIDFVTLKMFGKESKSDDKKLSIRLSIANLGRTKKLDYESWGDLDGLRSSHIPKLSDNFDNEYTPLISAGGLKVADQLKRESIYPGKSVSDVLVFEPPIATIDFLRLELPADAFGGTGKLRLKIPKDMIKGSAD